MKNRKRTKNYWLKKKESFQVIADSRSRAKTLRANKHTAHVVVDKTENKVYNVSYSVAKWYVEQLDELGIQL